MIPKSLPYRNYPDVEIMLHPLFLPSAGDMKGITKEMGGLPGVWLERYVSDGSWDGLPIPVGHRTAFD